MKKIKASLKIFFLIFFTLIVLNVKSSLILTGTLFLLVIMLSSSPAKTSVLKRLKVLFSIAVMIFFLQTVFNRQEPLFWRLSLAYLTIIKISLVSMAVLYFMTIVSPSEIIMAFWFLPRDFKLVLTMTFYFIPAIFLETEQIIIVQKSRGLKNFNLNFAPIVVPLLHRIFRRAETLSLSMISRGYEE